MNRFFLLVAGFLLVTLPLHAQDLEIQETVEPGYSHCNVLLLQRMTFLVDGSFQSEQVPAREIAKLKGCGVDDFDIQFFGNMNAMTSMLAKMTQNKKIEELTYSDLLTEIYKIKETELYKKVRAINKTSDVLAKRVGNFKNWLEDEKLFDELGSSAGIKTKVLNYLREHPENTKTYKQILESLKK